MVQENIVREETIQESEGIRMRHIVARAGQWGLLLLGLLAVCASLPLIALSF